MNDPSVAFNIEDRLMRFTPCFSCACCGGPVFALSLALVSFGILFRLLSAIELGWVFAGIGAATFGLCMVLASEPAAIGRRPRGQVD